MEEEGEVVHRICVCRQVCVCICVCVSVYMYCSRWFVHCANAIWPSCSKWTLIMCLLDTNLRLCSNWSANVASCCRWPRPPPPHGGELQLKHCSRIVHVSSRLHHFCPPPRQSCLCVCAIIRYTQWAGTDESKSGEYTDWLYLYRLWSEVMPLLLQSFVGCSLIVSDQLRIHNEILNFTCHIPYMS